MTVELDVAIAEWKGMVQEHMEATRLAREAASTWMGEYFHAKAELVNANKGIRKLRNQAHRRKAENYLLRLRLQELEGYWKWQSE